MKLPKGVTYFFRLNNEHLWIVLVSFIVLGIVLVTQFTYGISHSDSFWAALLPNFFADVIGILVTTYLLTYLLQRNEGKKQKKEIFEVLGYDYNRVVRDMARNYLLLITRNTDFINDEEKRIAEVRKGLDDARRSDKILDMSKILEVQEEIEHTRLPSWKKIFIFQNPAIQEFYSQRNSIRREVSSINKLYPRPEKGGG
ncbi:TPA: hypothetical protein ACTZ5N_003425 [Bacillus cereus]